MVRTTCAACVSIQFIYCFSPPVLGHQPRYPLHNLLCFMATLLLSATFKNLSRTIRRYAQKQQKFGRYDGSFVGQGVGHREGTLTAAASKCALVYQRPGAVSWARWDILNGRYVVSLPTCLLITHFPCRRHGLICMYPSELAGEAECVVGAGDGWGCRWWGWEGCGRGQVIKRCYRMSGG